MASMVASIELMARRNGQGAAAGMATGQFIRPGQFSELFDKIFSVACDAPILILDDLAEAHRDWLRVTLQDLITDRHDAGLWSLLPSIAR